MGLFARATETLAKHGAKVRLDVLAWPTGMGLALAISMLAVWHSPDAWWTNRVTYSDQQRALLFLAAGMTLSWGAFLGAFRFRRERNTEFTSFVQTQAPRFTWILGVPFVVALSAPIEARHPWLALFFSILVAGSFGYSAFHSCFQFPAAWTSSRVARGLPIFVLLIAGAGFITSVSALQIVNHQALNTSYADLGIYDNILYKSAHGDPLGCSLSRHWSHYARGHFDPILVLISPLYRLYPRAEALPVIQAVIVVSGVIPLYWLSRRATGSSASGLAMGLAYYLHPAMHAISLSHFHSMALVIPVFLWVFWAFEAERWKLYSIGVVVLLLVREDAAFLTATLGIYGLLKRRPREMGLGLLTFGVSIAYFLAVKNWVMLEAEVLPQKLPHGRYFKDLVVEDRGLSSMLLTILSNPVFVLKKVLTGKKLLFACQLLVPLVFLPLLAPRGRVLLVFGTVFTLLASREWLFDLYFHYSSWLLPVLFALTSLAIGRLATRHSARNTGDNSLRRALSVAVLSASIMCSWKFGGLIENESFRAGFRPLERSLDERRAARYRWLRETIETIPKDASVAATDLLVPHISNRHFAYRFLAARARAAEYVLVDAAYVQQGKEAERFREWSASRQLQKLRTLGSITLYRTHWKYSPDEQRDIDAKLKKARERIWY